MSIVLDSQQLAVVNSTANKICVIAGAGSGKTFMLTERVRRLLKEGKDASKFVCITFTKMAAQEMRSRLADIPGSNKMFIGTIHSLAYKTFKLSGKIPKLLTPDRERAIARELIQSYAKTLTIEKYDEWCEKRRLVEIGYLKKYEAENVLSMDEAFELYKILDMKNPSDLFEYVEEGKADSLVKEILEYERKFATTDAYPETVTSYAAKNDIITFNALLDRCNEFFGKNNIEYLFVDEFQDVGLFEYRFLKSLDAKNVFVVGDDFQSVYAFKGADFEYFKKLAQSKEFTTFRLENNYRSSKKIVKFGNDIISAIHDVIPKNCVSKCSDADIGSTIVKESGTLHTVEKYLKYIDSRDYGKWFLLTRSNNDLVDISRLCYRLNIPAITFKKSNITYDDLKTAMADNSVKILTIHSAKGLESENVLLYGKFPLKPTEFDWGDETEECRIYYVGATRAKRNLVIVDNQSNF